MKSIKNQVFYNVLDEVDNNIRDGIEKMFYKVFSNDVQNQIYHNLLSPISVIIKIHMRNAVLREIKRNKGR